MEVEIKNIYFQFKDVEHSLLHKMPLLKKRKNVTLQCFLTDQNQDVYEGEYNFLFQKNIETTHYEVKPFTIETDNFQEEKSLFNLIKLDYLPMPYRFALELALFNLIIDYIPSLKIKYLINAYEKIKYNSLYPDLSAQNVKIKVSPQNIDKVKEIIKNNPNINFILDANQQLPFETDLSALLVKNVSYIEEPFSENMYLKNKRIALDETIRLQYKSFLVSKQLPEHIDYYIIKTTHFDSVPEMFLFLNFLQRNNKKIIFTYAFESKTLVEFLLLMASKYSPHEVHGLGIAEEIIPLDIIFTRYWKISFRSNQTLTINNKSMLKEIFSKAYSLTTIIPPSSSHISYCGTSTKHHLLCFFASLLLKIPYRPVDQNTDSAQLCLNDSDLNELLPISSKHKFSIKLDQKSLEVLTSGTTASSKIISHDLYTIFSTAFIQTEKVNFTKSNSWPLTLNASHIGGFMILMRVLLRGANTTDLLSVNEIENDHLKNSFLSCVPYQLSKLLERKLNLGQLKMLLVSGDKTPTKLIELCLKQNINIYTSYGSSETCSFVTLANTDDLKRNPSTSGHALFGVEINIKNKYIEIKKGGKTISTNDSGQMINECLEIHGRFDNIIIRGGVNINLDEVCSAFTASEIIRPYVFDDKNLGKNFYLFYCSKSDQEISQVILCLPKYKRPKKAIPFFFNDNKKKNNLDFSLIHKKFQDNGNCYFQWKSFGNKNLPHLILLPGIFNSLDDFKPLINDLINNFQVLFPIYPGKKETSFSNPYYNAINTIERLAFLIEQDIHSFSTSPTIYAYSFGGRIVQFFSPDLLKKSHLIMESSYFGLDCSTQRQKRLLADSQRTQNYQTTNKFFYDWYRSDLFQHTCDDIIRKRVQDYDLYNIHELFIRFGPGSYSPNSMKSYPIKFFCGSNDEKYLRILRKKTSNTINWKLVEINDAHHDIHRTHAFMLTEHLLENHSTKL